MIVISLFAIIFFFLVVIADFGNVSHLSAQNRLVNDMLKWYDKKVKPTRWAQDAVVVSFSMELYQIIEVVSVKRTMWKTA